jgi:hypothetical protein
MTRLTTYSPELRVLQVSRLRPGSKRTRATANSRGAQATGTPGQQALAAWMAKLKIESII